MIQVLIQERTEHFQIENFLNKDKAVKNGRMGSKYYPGNAGQDRGELQVTSEEGKGAVFTITLRTNDILLARIHPHRVLLRIFVHNIIIAINKVKSIEGNTLIASEKFLSAEVLKLYSSKSISTFR